jgi:hypothetical protein
MKIIQRFFCGALLDSLGKSFFLFLFILPVFTACDTEEGEPFDKAFYTFQIQEVFKTDALQTKYHYFFKGKEISFSVPTLADNPEGVLKIMAENSDTPLLETTISPAKNDTVKIIILNDSAYFYTPEDFPSFSVNITYQTGQSDLYSINYFSGNYEQTLTSGTNYVAAENSVGMLQMVRNSDNTAVFSKGISITDGTRIDLLQLGEDQFLDATIPAGEADPADREHCKIRFYLDLAIDTGGSAVRVLVYNAATTDATIETLDFDPATSISPFTEIAINGSYKYEVYKLSDMTKLVSKRTIAFNNTGEWKFQTLKAAKYLSTFMEDLSVKW